MGKSKKTVVLNNIRVDLTFNPRIGPVVPGRYFDKYYKMQERCREINRLLKPLNLYCLAFYNPFFYGAIARKHFSFELNEKEWIPPRKLKQLQKILKSKPMKNQGLVGFKIRKVKETRTTIREYEEVK